MTEEQESKVAELRRTIAATAGDGVPLEVRVAVVAWKRELRRGGTTARELAAALGVHESTLCRWERESGGGGESTAANSKGRVPDDDFRMVRVASVPVSPTRSASELRSSSGCPPRGLRVAHVPSGLVVEGLDVETLAALLRRLS